MTELRRPLSAFGDDELGVALRALSGSLDGPTSAARPGAPDPARRARLRIEAGDTGRSRPAWWPSLGGRARPLRRSFVLALVALAVLVAIVGAIGLGVPGIRIIFTGGPSPSSSIATVPVPTSTPSPTATASTPPGPLGSALDLGFATTLAEAPTLAGFPLLVPDSPSLGPADTVWFRDGRVSLVWAARPGLPETEAEGIGLLITEFRGSVHEDLFQKVLGPRSTLTPVTVNGETGWWISGAVHEFMYLDRLGNVVSESRRVVADSLIWTRGDLTLRMETSLGRAAAIALAETIR
jgi:hypothetical protein